MGFLSQDAGTRSDPKQQYSSSGPDPADIVLASTSSKIRTFLYEIAEGTTNYRSLHNLTQQVEHQYHGRFLVELIQNAHDALIPDASPAYGRIEITLVENEEQFGVLYVANDGAPFSESNFVSLSQLGQSDKDPERSIGNKGIGFRSVLEITSSPQIFSRLASDSAHFDGFCFGFSPRVLTDLTEPVLELAATGISPVSPFCDASLVDWDLNLLSKFKRAVARHDHEWLEREISFLSPYLLPIPVGRTQTAPIVSDFELDGFSTVIRLPLQSESARETVRLRLSQLPTDTVLFLDRASSLTMRSDGLRREWFRTAVKHSTSKHGCQTVTISTGEPAESEEYKVWSRNLETAAQPEEFRQALARLPGRWPDLKEIRISVAVRTGDVPAEGVFSVFLPTLLRTGSATYVNAPFFADMSRTNIDLESELYNRGLLQEALNLSVAVVRDELAGTDAVSGRPIVDLLAPFGDDAEATRWRSGVLAELDKHGINLADQPWLLSGSGWSKLSTASLLPKVPDALVFNESTFRSHATFPVFHPSLDSRSAQLTSLSNMAGYGIYPSAESLAETCEAVASTLHSGSNANWNAFWSETAELLHSDATQLRGRRVLLGTDEQLHAAGDECSVFFIPRQGAGEDDDVLSESAITGIPARLRPYVAFLHSSIDLYEPQNLRLQTKTRKFLEKTLVNRFRVQDIFSEVLIKRMPNPPIGLRTGESELCADILNWGMSLLANLAGRGRGDRTIKMAEDLMLPCIGGWFKAKTTSYGAGWPSTLGAALHKYLMGSKTPDGRQAAKRLLLPPNHPLWRGNATNHPELLEAAGVASGLRVINIEPGDWQSGFWGSNASFGLPTEPPPHFSAQLWSDYRESVRSSARPYYAGPFPYQIQAFFAVPGLSEFARFHASTKMSLMELLLNSIPSWPKGWETSECKKTYGISGNVQIESPLSYALRSLPWIRIKSRNQEFWQTPSERWYVPAKVMRTREWQFEHLHPLPFPIAHLLDQSETLRSVMSSLGMPQYDPESKSGSTRLLETLVEAAEREEIRDANVFLGQVRSAWASFVPDSSSRLPSRILVNRSGRGLEAATPSTKNRVYLPDSSRSSLASLEQFDIPVIAIESVDAKRLSANFLGAYGGGVIPTSSLRIIPITDGREWTAEETVPFNRSEIHWIAPLALTLAAHYGVTARGVGSAKFGAQVQAFREARVSWCATLSVGLCLDQDKIAQPTTPAIWIASAQTLLATSNCLADPRLLSEAMTSILDREDLEVPLKLLFGETRQQPSHERIVDALKELRLSEAQFMEVSSQWTGALRSVLDLLVPLITLIYPAKNIDRLLQAQSDDDLFRFLDSCQDPSLDGHELVRLAHECPDPYEFGMRCHLQMVKELTLSGWSASVANHGGRPLRNRQASDEFETHISQARLPLRSMLAYIFSIEAPKKSFKELVVELESIRCPSEFTDSLWRVEFNDALMPYSSFFVGIGAASQLQQLLENSDSLKALVAGLQAIGVDVDIDPIERARDNRERLRQTLVRFQQLGLAWAVSNDSANANSWEVGVDALLVSLDPVLNTDAYLRVWNEESIISLLGQIPVLGRGQGFWDTLANSTSLAKLQGNLHLSDEAVAAASSKLRDLKEEARRRNRMIQVCGHDFDGTEDNLGTLWSHICREIPENAISDLPSIDLSRPMSLSSFPSARSSSRPGGGGAQTPHAPISRPTKAMEMLVGMAGEIHAFRRLQSQYGSDIVTSSSWVSTNGTTVFPENESFADDGAGFDFKFTTGGRTFFIEVKSSSGADETFTLGSSEIRFAIELARPKRIKSRERFIIMRVLNALSQQPSFQVLPNPYDERYQDYYVIVEAGARVRYRLSKGI